MLYIFIEPGCRVKDPRVSTDENEMGFDMLYSDPDGFQSFATTSSGSIRPVIIRLVGTRTLCTQAVPLQYICHDVEKDRFFK